MEKLNSNAANSVIRILFFHKSVFFVNSYIRMFAKYVRYYQIIKVYFYE